MREWQSLLQVLHVHAGCWKELTQSFLRTRLSVVACVNLSSPVLRCLVTAPLHCDRSTARFSQVSVSISTAFMSRFTTSRYRNCGRPVTGSPSSKYVVYATAYVYRELHGKITDRKKNCVNNYLN